MTDRFVILEHRRSETHWDVMLERAGTLRTWAVDSPIQPGTTLPARALPDHRLAYLEYEGPISGDRGVVRRDSNGTYSIIEWSDDRIIVDLQGDQLSGRLMLSREGGTAWSLRLSAPGNVD